MRKEADFEGMHENCQIELAVIDNKHVTLNLTEELLLLLLCIVLLQDVKIR